MSFNRHCRWFDKGLMLGVSVAALLAPSAATAQGAKGPAWSWQGLYAGVHAGYGWGDTGFSCTSVLGSGCASFDTAGPLWGGQLGYNWKLGNVVLGLEGDFSFPDVEGDAFFGAKNASSDLDWMATLRGRAGLLVSDSMLLYGTGGVAWGDWNDRLFPLSTTSSFSDIYTGYTVGGGLETKISHNMTLKLEYLYADFGDKTYNWADSGVSGTATFDHELHTVRLGLNVKLY